MKIPKNTTHEKKETDRALGQWRRRLDCVDQQQGGHIEHLM